MEFSKDFKPHRRILGGDVFDFASFRAGAGEADREESLESDLQAGLELVREFRPTDWCLGNHDVRPWTIAKTGKTAALRDYAAQVCRQMESAHQRIGCRMYGYRVPEFCPIGRRLKAIHGFCGGKFPPPRKLPRRRRAAEAESPAGAARRRRAPRAPAAPGHDRSRRRRR